VIAGRTEHMGWARKALLMWGSLLAGVLLAASVSAAPAMSAVGVTGPTGPLGSVVPPKAPKVSAPAVPEVPVKVPTLPPGQGKAPKAPKVPAAPQTSPAGTAAVHAPARPPSSPQGAPVPSGRPGGTPDPGVDLPSAPAVTGVETGSVGTSTSPGTSTVGAQSPDATARGRADGGSGERAAAPPGVKAGSIASAKAAPLRSLVAYVWPAIALGPGVGKLLTTLEAQWQAVASLPAAGATRLLLRLARAVRVSGAADVPGQGPAALNPPRGDPQGLRIPAGSEVSSFVLIPIVLCAMAMALLVVTLRRELRSMHRWPL
jgi:hypothetical protein